MKKKYIVIFMLLLAAAVIGLGVNYLLSLRKVTFKLESGTSAITIYTSKNNPIKLLSSDGHVFLQEGEYYAVPEGENIATDRITFSVGNQDSIVVIDPSYTKEYLQKIFEKERPVIETAIAKKYPTLISEYIFEQGELYRRGEWSGGLLVPKAASYRDQGDPYRVILYKEGGEWKVFRRPEYILTSSRYKEVPISILRAVNQIVQ